jgi:hypothetical protein
VADKKLRPLSLGSCSQLADECREHLRSGDIAGESCCVTLSERNREASGYSFVEARLSPLSIKE